MDTLFDDFDRDQLRDRLQTLAARKILIGGSSWKYEGWLGQIYSRWRYQTRGRFSRKLFEDTCLNEYAATFPTVCGDFTFYQFPSEAMWSKLFRQTPDTFRWAFKVPEQITVPGNPTFLDAALFNESFLRPLELYRNQVGILIFEFGTFREKTFETPSQFIQALDPFLDQLPVGWRYAVEIRNAEFLVPDYFACLRAHNVPHVYNAWTRMPEIGDQFAILESRTSDLIVCRALLHRGRPYEDAVRLFRPYDRVREVNESVRRSLRELVNVAMVDGVPAFIFVNNRLEGNSPGTIVAITD